MEQTITNWKNIEMLCGVLRPYIGKLDEHPELKESLKELQIHIFRLGDGIHGSIIEHEARSMVAESKKDFREAAIEISRELKKILDLYDTFIGCDDPKLYEFALANRKPQDIARKTRAMLCYCKMSHANGVHNSA